jgi:DNA-binding NarL/FixJ family response regulator
MKTCGAILVVDHDDAARAAAAEVVARLGYSVVEAESADQAIKWLNGSPPELAIVEVELPGVTSGLELLRALHVAYGAAVPVILVSETRTAPLDHVAGLLLGADDYVAKPFDAGELLARVRRSVSRSAAGGNAVGIATRSSGAGLSPRELEILALLAGGMGQSEIAERLVLSPKTVGTHIQHVLSKLGVHSRAQAVAEAYRLGLASPDFAAHGLGAELKS